MVGWSNRWFNPDKSPITAQEIGVGFADTLLLGAGSQPVPASRSRSGKKS
jgi:hypothetical protein